MFPWPVRVFVLIPLAAVQFVLLSATAFGFEYSVPFENFIRWLGDSFASFFAPVEEMIRRALAMIAVSLPKLGAHWHHVFVLLWLLFGSWARLNASFAKPAPLLSQLWFRKALTKDIPQLLWAGLCAIAVAVAVGTRPLDSQSVVFWPMAGLCLFLSSTGSPPLRALGLVLALAGAWLGLSTEPLEKLWGIATTTVAPGLFFLVCAVGFFGLFVLVVGLFVGKTWRERLTNPRAAMGFDILGTYALAATLAAIGKYLL